MDMETYAADDNTVEDWEAFAGILEQPVSGDLVAEGADELEERAEALIRGDADLMAEAVDQLKMWDIPVRGKSDDDVIWLLREGCIGGLVSFYIDNRRAMDKIF